MALRSRIPVIIAELDDELLAVVEELGNRIAEGAKAAVPVDTGALRDAIHVEVDGKSVRVVAGDGDAYYGHIVENGSVKAPARPFLIPAFEAERQNLDEIAEEGLEDL